MILTINIQKKKEAEQLFTLFSKFQAELCLFPDGLKWRISKESAEGIVYKSFFAEYPFNFKHRLGIVPNKARLLKKWLSSWKIKNNLIEIPIK